MTGTRSNSFHFVPILDVPRPPGAPCPVREGPTLPHDVPRQLFVRLRDRMRLFRTRSHDFSREEIGDVKEVRHQVYLDVSTKLAPDDFAVDLRRLRISRECVTCDRRAECGACWVAAGGPGFAEADRQVRLLLESLEGSVLDVGCGEGPYAAVLAEKARQGSLTYLGLDPDAARVALLASRYPWARYHVGTLQTLAREEPGARFDHVVFLRSFNHLPSPERELELAARVLSPGGTLLLVDNVAFGLIRSREQALRAEGGPAAFEHYRNDSAADAIARAPGGELRVVDAADVGPETCNQWWVRFERLSE